MNHYDEQFWRCPYCVHMQNLSRQPGNPNQPYMTEPEQPPYYQQPPMGSGMGMPGMMPGNSNMMPGNPGMMGPGPQMPPYMQPAGQGNTRPMPYYQTYGYPATYYDEQENEKDMQRMKEMYPDVAKKILQYVEEECDKMEYEGSMMFDEQPDRVMLLKITNDIYDKVKDDFELPEDEDKDELFAMNKETRRRYPPRKNWLGDMIDVLLFQEMHRRRCRHRNCRRWY